MKFDYIIYHRNCFDGFAGYVIFMQTENWIKGIKVYPDYPFSKIIPSNIKDKNIIIIDVAYAPDILEDIVKEAKQVLYIDHHITNIEEKKKLEKKYGNLEIYYDINNCGASLVWKYFFNNVEKPNFVKYIQDNDIGIWKYKDTLPMITYIDMKYGLSPNTDNLNKWQKLLNNTNLENILQEGRLYYEYKKFLINQNARHHMMVKFPSELFYNDHKEHFERIGQYRVAIVESACPDKSLVGNKIINTYKCDFAIIWTLNITKKIYMLSLRSKKTDVARIAEKVFGSGGHRLASGGQLSAEKYNIYDIFIINLKNK
jgi:oligoribonuclease NrnB/cAMP/cGMP phosphodiesterase (DHH superfamily)